MWSEPRCDDPLPAMLIALTASEFRSLVSAVLFGEIDAFV